MPQHAAIYARVKARITTLRWNRRQRSVPNWRTAIARMWNSPTFTSWAQQGTMAVQLLLLAPLLLKHLDATQFAAWYLFSSINMFGALLMARVALTFSRTIALEVGTCECNGVQNLGARLEKLFGAFTALQCCMGMVSLIIATAIGMFSLGPLVSNYDDPAAIWLSLGICQLAGAVSPLATRYNTILMGFGEVAKNNRCVISGMLVSTMVVVLGLALGANLVALTALNQVGQFFGGFLARERVKKLSSAKGVLSTDSICWSNDVVAASWTPISRGFITGLATTGVMPMSAMLVARYMSTETAAGYALTTRILLALDLLASAPYNAVQPHISMLFGQNRVAEILRIVLERGRVALALQSAALLGMAVSMPLVVRLSGDSVRALHPIDTLLIGEGMLALKFYSICIGPFLARNQVILWKEALVASAITILLMGILLQWIGVCGIGVSIVVGALCVYRAKPMNVIADEFGISADKLFRSVMWPTAVLFAVILSALASVRLFVEILMGT